MDHPAIENGRCDSQCMGMCYCGARLHIKTLVQYVESRCMVIAMQGRTSSRLVCPDQTFALHGTSHSLLLSRAHALCQCDTHADTSEHRCGLGLR